MKNLILLILFFFFNSFSYGQDFITKHPNCKVGILEKVKTSYPDLFEVLRDNFKERGYLTSTIPKGAKMNPGEFYATMEKHLLGWWFYPSCYVKIVVKKSVGKYIGPKDEDFYDRSTKRQFPRISFSGLFRCKRAIKDLFVHIPYCRIEEK